MQSSMSGLGCSDPEMLKFTFLSAEKDKQSKFTTMGIRRADFGLFKNLSFYFSLPPSFRRNSFVKIALEVLKYLKLEIYFKYLTELSFHNNEVLWWVFFFLCIKKL